MEGKEDKEDNFDSLLIIRKAPSSPHANWVKLAAVKKFLSIAETTQKREPAQLIVAGKYRIGKKISNGAFGQLRLVTDVFSGENLAIKLEPENAQVEKSSFRLINLDFCFPDTSTVS